MTFKVGRVDPLPPHLLPIAPPAVREASEAHAAALTRLAALRGQAHEAREAADAASGADAASALAAVEAGKAVPAPTAPKAAAALDGAIRAVAAADQLAQQSQDSYIAVLNERAEEMAATIRDRVDTIRATATMHADALEEAIRESYNLGYVVDELLSGVTRHRRDPTFNPVRPYGRRGPYDHAAGVLDEARARLGGPKTPGRAQW